MSDAVELKPGDEAPAFSAVDENGEQHTLQHYLDKGKSVILYFYPKDNTPGCTVEAKGFRDAEAELAARGAVVLGVSRDSVRTHANFVAKQSLNFRLLSEIGRAHV